MILLLASIVLDVAQVLSFVLILFCYLGNIDLSNWMTSLTIALVFLRGLGLRLISGRRIVGLSLVFIFVESFIAIFSKSVVFVFCGKRPIPFWAPGINPSSLGRWLQTGLGFCINSFLYYLILRI